MNSVSKAKNKQKKKTLIEIQMFEEANFRVKLRLNVSLDEDKIPSSYPASLEGGKMPIKFIDVVCSAGSRPSLLAGLFLSSNTSSLSLFIIKAELLSKGMSSLFAANPSLYYNTSRGIKISHLAYADDIVIFSNAKEQGLVVLMDFLKSYEIKLGQRISYGKVLLFEDEIKTSQMGKSHSFSWGLPHANKESFDVHANFPNPSYAAT
ncbi:hypothetical protein BUALT_Bualt12G0079500 [Buddleja alternifolia]|uniref:Reverse transcriptase domain-containing protein n=1 Tax=Buddleja alternifolia TaxID=168488 RepID=A0AAV6WVR1_9LAMI|nr:hypothetical protein BUALT_Bualt12G0079500 [Buddleja alternifolia]